ncbi:hypothetical protein MTQ16_03370, partial [Corynebacterium bovis]|uniref:hypothetical protein n=1 Tax=Corynebacterium bovis TaxID=36808 RepID=UPI003138FD78
MIAVEHRDQWDRGRRVRVVLIHPGRRRGEEEAQRLLAHRRVKHRVPAARRVRRAGKSHDGAVDPSCAGGGDIVPFGERAGERATVHGMADALAVDDERPGPVERIRVRSQVTG